MNREVLEDIWILPKINEIINLIPSKFETTDEKIKLLSVFFKTIAVGDVITSNSEENDNLNIVYTFTQSTSYIYFLIKKYDVGDFHEELNNQYHSIDYSYEEIDFFELVLSNANGQSVDIEDLNRTEKELVCRMKSERYGKICFELINHIKDLILTRRISSDSTIDSMIFD